MDAKRPKKPNLPKLEVGNGCLIPQQYTKTQLLMFNNLIYVPERKKEEKLLSVLRVM